MKFKKKVHQCLGFWEQEQFLHLNGVGVGLPLAISATYTGSSSQFSQGQ